MKSRSFVTPRLAPLFTRLREWGWGALPQGEFFKSKLIKALFALLQREREKSCPGKKGHPPSRFNFSELLYEKKVDPFALANRTHACSDCLALAGRAKVFVWRKVGPAKGWPLLSVKGDPARLVIPSSRANFLFLM